MYYVMATAHDGPFIAKAIATAPTSTQARRLAFELDTASAGGSVGRLFYLDEDSYIRWRTAGRVGAPDALPEPDPALNRRRCQPA